MANRTNEIRLFPNPAQNVITLELNGTQVRSAEVLDLCGRVMHLESVQIPTESIQFFSGELIRSI